MEGRRVCREFRHGRDGKTNVKATYVISVEEFANKGSI